MGGRHEPRRAAGRGRGHGPATAAFAENLRRTRTRLGLSQERLASVCALHRTEISLLERGEREPRLSTIVRLARGLGVPPSALLDGLE
jgi:transcriptional regulator with XRE-family HTH domain